MPTSSGEWAIWQGVCLLRNYTLDLSYLSRLETPNSFLVRLSYHFGVKGLTGVGELSLFSNYMIEIFVVETSLGCWDILITVWRNNMIFYVDISLVTIRSDGKSGEFSWTKSDCVQFTYSDDLKSHKILWTMSLKAYWTSYLKPSIITNLDSTVSITNSINTSFLPPS